MSLAQIDTDERHLNLTKAYSDAARVAAANATDGLRFDHIEMILGLLRRMHIDRATTEVGNADTAATNAETAYADASDATGAELVTLATVTAKVNYDAAVRCSKCSGRYSSGIGNTTHIYCRHY